LDPSQLAVYTNRAQAYLQLKLYDYAIMDCDTALELWQQQAAAGATYVGFYIRGIRFHGVAGVFGTLLACIVTQHLGSWSSRQQHVFEVWKAGKWAMRHTWHAYVSVADLK
jgi:hypothetical protein